MVIGSDGGEKESSGGRSFQRCSDENCMVGELEMNSDQGSRRLKLEDDRVEWPGWMVRSQ